MLQQVLTKEKMILTQNLPYYKQKILPRVINSNNVIISAHGNSIRAIVMDIFNLSPEQILKTEIGWCEPWKISYDTSGNLSDYKIISRPSEPSKSHLYSK